MTNHNLLPACPTSTAVEDLHAEETANHLTFQDALEYPETPIFESSPQFTPSESFDRDMFLEYKEDASYQYPYNSAYMQSNYFRASPPYQPEYCNYESQQNHQNVYLGSNQRLSSKKRFIEPRVCPFSGRGSRLILARICTRHRNFYLTEPEHMLYFQIYLSRVEPCWNPICSIES